MSLTGFIISLHWIEKTKLEISLTELNENESIELLFEYISKKHSGFLGKWNNECDFEFDHNRLKIDELIELNQYIKTIINRNN